MDMLTLTSGKAVVLILINNFVAKAYMSTVWRLAIVFAGDKRKRTDLVESGFFKNSHAAQLNEAEWSPIFVATLLFLNLKGIDAPLASSLAAYGSIWYLWAKIYLPFPSHTIGATMRYVALGMICWELYGLLM
jgi:uncharacterized MAPEG superfamily protein